MTTLIIILAALLSGAIQSMTGFGGAIILMMILPFVMPLKLAASIVGLICIPMLIQLVWIYRKNIDVKKVLLPIPVYLFSNTLSIQFAATTNMERFKPIFGLFLILLALYFIFFSNRLSIKATPLTGILFALLAGITGGFFGIGGPFLVIYFLEAIDDSKTYLGTVNFTFMIVELYSAGLRLYNGLIPLDIWQVLLISFAMVLIGSRIGVQLTERINSAQMQKLIYGVLIASGVFTVVTSI